MVSSLPCKPGTGLVSTSSLPVPGMWGHQGASHPFCLLFTLLDQDLSFWEPQTPGVGRDPLTSAGKFVYSCGSNVLGVRYGPDPGEDATFQP